MQYRFINEKACTATLPTIGIPHSFVSYQLSNGSLVNASIVDTAGQETLRTLSNQYYKKADGILLEPYLTALFTFSESPKNSL